MSDKETHALLRLAGKVKRLHTVPTIRQHTIAEHVYGSLLLARRLLHLNHDVDSECVFVALLHHDAAEVHTGDVPAPVKRENDMLHAGLLALEEEFDSKHRLGASLDKKGNALVKACDTLDLGWTCVEEAQLGNRHPALRTVMYNVMQYIQAQYHINGVPQLAEEVRLAWEEATK